MKKNFLLPILFVLATTLSSCEALIDIFQAGIWVGVIAVVLVVGIILWVVRKVKK